MSFNLSAYEQGCNAVSRDISGDKEVQSLQREDKSPVIMSSGQEQLRPVWAPCGVGDLTTVKRHQMRQQGLGKDREQIHTEVRLL